MDRETNKSKMFGFLKFENKDECIKAVNEMNGVEILGRRVRLNYATPRP